MNNKEANKIVRKCMNVIVSCKNQDQLNVAVKYAGLAYKVLSREIGLVNNTNFILLIERSIGFALCNIGGNHQTQIPNEPK